MNATVEYGSFLGECKRCLSSFTFALPDVPESNLSEPDESGKRAETFRGNCPHCDAPFRFQATFDAK